MCGFAGFLSKNKQSDQKMRIESMLLPLLHRGPDDGGTWVDPNAGLALGHRRLSIQDISPFGHQPMESHSSQFVIAYNGEIYNFKILRKELETLGCCFRGHSDTEVLLTAVEMWGG
jgi:asparagine synthase (glutamine-hydrolysing)